MKVFLSPPKVDETLVEYLQQVFPNRLPPLNTDERKLGSLIGQQEVIEHLRAISEQQKEE
jgi:hypothetical protein